MLHKPTGRLPLLLLGAFLSLGISSAFSDAYDLVPRTSETPDFQYHPSPQDWRDVNMYQLFTDRFFDGNNFEFQVLAPSP